MSREKIKAEVRELLVYCLEFDRFGSLDDTEIDGFVERICQLFVSQISPDRSIAINWINNYLKEQFICNLEEIPDNECLEESIAIYDHLFPLNQLYEPEQIYTLTCDNCKRAYESSEAFPSYQFCTDCSALKPDESRLLTENAAIDAYEHNNPADDHAIGVKEVAKAQDAKTVSILKQKCQERIRGA